MRTTRGIGLLLATGAVALALAGCGASPTPATAHVTAPAPAATATHRVTPAAARRTPAAPPAACAHTPKAAKRIIVSIRQQHLWACQGRRLILEGPVTTGASALTNVHDATPIGTSRITGKIRNTVLSGSDANGSWNDHVHYWMPFNGGDGFHDAPWQRFPLGSPLYRTKGSHGCVHLSLHDVAALYRWARVGTVVTVRR